MAQPLSAIRIDVDTQKGFCDPRGALYVRGAEAILPAVARLDRDAVERGIPLLGTMDAHHYRSAEFVENGGLWPRHCVRGTWDQLKEESTLVERFRIVPWEARVDLEALFDGGRAALYFEKDAYSPFANPNFAPMLDLLEGRAGGPAGAVYQVYGVALDYCVRATALDLRRRGARVVVVRDACAAVAAESGEEALRAMREAGIDVIGTEDALARPAARGGTA